MTPTWRLIDDAGENIVKNLRCFCGTDKSKSGEISVNFGRFSTHEDSFNVSGSFRAQCALFLVVLRASRSRIRAILVSRVPLSDLARAVTLSHSVSLRPSPGDSESNFEVPFG